MLTAAETFGHKGGSESDMGSLPMIEEKLKNEEHLPEELFADAGYGSDDNYVKSAENGVKLIAPAPHQPENKVGLNECKFDENNCIVECPAGKRPCSRRFKDGKERAVFFNSVCDECPLEKQMSSSKMRETKSRIQIYGCRLENLVSPQA